MRALEQVTRVLGKVIGGLAGLVALILAIGIAFKVLGGNPKNGIVSTFTDVAKWLAGPFDGMFAPKDQDLAVALNWGIALIVYLIAARIVVGLLERRQGEA